MYTPKDSRYLFNIPGTLERCNINYKASQTVIIQLSLTMYVCLWISCYCSHTPQFERLVATMVDKELKERKARGTYVGKFGCPARPLPAPACAMGPRAAACAPPCRHVQVHDAPLGLHTILYYTTIMLYYTIL